MKYLLWLLKAAIFFTQFAVALNNPQDATVHFFFGTQWRAPQVLIVLAALTLGVALGVLVMVPRCGHMLTMEKPEEVNATLQAWLQTI